MSNNPAQDYPLAPATRGRLFGVSLIVLGLLILVFGGLATLRVFPNEVLAGLLALAIIALVALVAALGPKHWIVRLDDTGYSVRFIRTAGVKASRWVEVNELEATTVAGARCVVLHLKDGKTTTIPVDLIAGGGQSFAEAIAKHLKATNV